MTGKEAALAVLSSFKKMQAALDQRLAGLMERLAQLEARQVPPAGMGAKEVQALIEQAIKAIPAPEQPKFRQPEDGEPGRDALQIEILPYIDPDRTYARGTYASHRGGVLRAARTTDYLDTLKDGETVETKGWQVVLNGIAEQLVEQIDERTFAVKSVSTSGAVVEKKIAMPVMIYRGIWREAEYQRGDTTTWAGSLWHCEKPTKEKPGTGPDWRLAAKRGADGKNLARAA